MGTTVTNTVVYGDASSRVIAIMSTIVSTDGTELTDSVLYDNSAYVANVVRGSLLKLEVSGSSCQLTFEWDQTTDSPIAVLDPVASPSFDLSDIGGIHNPGGTGATGDLVVTSANIDSGDVVSVYMLIKQV